MGCLTAPSHRSVRMKFVVILSFLLLGVVLGDPLRYYGSRGYGGYYGGYRGGYYGRVRYGKRSADADAAPVADAYRRYYGGGYGGYRGGYHGYGGYRGYHRGGFRGYYGYGR